MFKVNTERTKKFYCLELVLNSAQRSFTLWVIIVTFFGKVISCFLYFHVFDILGFHYFTRGHSYTQWGVTQGKRLMVQPGHTAKCWWDSIGTSCCGAGGCQPWQYVLLISKKGMTKSKTASWRSFSIVGTLLGSRDELCRKDCCHHFGGTFQAFFFFHILHFQLDYSGGGFNCLQRAHEN